MNSAQKPHWIRTALAIAAALILVTALIFFSRDRSRTPSDFFDFQDSAVNVPLLTGYVLAVQGDSFTLEVPEILGRAVHARSPLRTRVVRVGAATAITGRNERTAAEYETALKRYAAAETRGERAIPPHTYAELTLSLADLRVGDAVRVSELGFPDIKAQQEIDAGVITRF